MAASGPDLAPPASMAPVAPPAAVPALTFRTLEGAPAPLSAYAGRPLLLNFWATWCTPCVAELPELDRLAAQNVLPVLAVSADRGAAAAVSPFLATHAMPHLTVLLDPSSDGVHALDVAGFPTTFLIGPDARLRGVLAGPARWGDAAPALRRLLA